MRASFPTEFDAVLLGISRQAGGFDTPDGRVEYGEAYEMSFESSEGLAQTCRVGLKALEAASDFDVVKTPKLTLIRVVGDVQVRDDGGFFRPTQVRLAQPAKSAA